MKRSEIKIDLKSIISYTKQENNYQQRVYKARVAKEAMTHYAANRNILIIREYRELCEALMQKGYTYDDLKSMMKNLEDRTPRAKQSELTFPNLDGLKL